jgi:two-component sensor histidine kinase
MRTPESHVLDTGEPMISPDIGAEDRFEYPDFIIKHGVRALVTVIIVGTGDKPAYGVLEVDSRTPRAFTDADIQFLRSYANLLASAVERLRIHQELRDRAEEKERLLRELQHRVKNNLQTVMNLVSLRVRRARTSEAAQELRAVGDGIEALRLVHDKIYSANDGMDRTCLGTYLGELAASLLRFHGKEVSTKVRLVADVERLEVHPDCAVPLGLVTSEFVTNSLKYAFGNGRGVIGVRVERAEPELARVTLWDDGRGLPAERSGGTGLKLIEGLVRQVGGTPQWDHTQGTKLVITVPVASGFSS